MSFASLEFQLFCFNAKIHSTQSQEITKLAVMRRSELNEFSFKTLHCFGKALVSNW